MAVLLAHRAAAQTSVSGSVADAGGEPIPFANVLVLQLPDSSLVTGAITDIQGRFVVPIPTKQSTIASLLLQVRMLGYGSKEVLLASFGNTDVGEIMLMESAEQLSEIVIEAEQPLFQQQLDKLVVNVANSPVASGGTVLDVLERSPGLSVDRQSGGLAMNGKQGVVVMINGKQQRLPLSMVVQQLEGLSATQVQRVELISNPSSRYDAEGDAGIINIVTKKPPQTGTNGTATLGMGYSDLSGYFKPIGSLLLHHQRRRLKLYSSYSYNHDNRWQQWNYERLVPATGLQSRTVTNRHASWPIHRMSVGADWQVSDRTSINVLASGFSDYWEMESFNRSELNLQGRDSAVIHLYDQEVNHWKHAMGNLNVIHQLRDGARLSFDADYLYYHDHNPNDFTNTWHYEDATTLVEQVRTGKETPIRMGVAKLDYEKQWGEWKVETGAKSTISRLQNQVKLETLLGGSWVPDARFTHNYSLQDDVHALYINASGSLNPKSQLQLGLRAENTGMEVLENDESLYKLNFWKLFPTLFYAWHPTEKISWQLSYGRRITRPSYTAIAPFVIFMDPFTYYWGNLRLKPAISDGLQASFAYNDLLVTLRYSRNRFAIAGQQSRYNQEEGKTYIYADNVDLLSTLSLSAGWPRQLTPWWHVQTSGLLLYQQIDHLLNEVPLEMRQYASRWTLVQKFNLSGKLTFEVSGVYATPTRVGLTLRKAWGSITAGVQKDLGERGKLNLTVTDIFWTRNSVYLTNHPLLEQIQQTSYINEPRVVRLSYTLTFGNKQLKNNAGAARKRSTASQAEQERIN